MGEWNRFTKECVLESIRPEMTAAIQKHIETYNLGSILNDYLMCIETTSEKKKKGLFGGGGDKMVVQSAIITPLWLVLAVAGDKSGASALSAQLKDMVVTDYADTPGYKLLPDSGIEVTGIFTGRVGEQTIQRVSYFTGLGEEPAAKKFKETLSRAIQETRK